MKEELLEIYNYYGKSHQVSKLLEEIGELIETIMDIDRVNMKKEMADVLVLLYQFICRYDLNNDEIKQIMKYKVKRTLSEFGNERQGR